jgi:hypothetical protein
VTQTDEELGHEAHYAFNDILKRIGTRSFNQQKRAYEAWLTKYLPLAQARGLTQQARWLPRLVAQTLIMEAIEAKRPAHAFQPLLRDVEVLGWDDLNQKVLTMAALCSYFAERMWKREGMRYLLPLKREVKQEYARTGERTWANHLRSLSRLEERLRARSRPF